MGTLEPGAGAEPCFAQLYTLGGGEDEASGALGRLPGGGGVLTLPDSMLCVDSELSGWVYVLNRELEYP